MKHSEIVGCFLLPPDQQTPVTVDPAMTSLHHPALSGFSMVVPRFFASGTNMRNQAPQPKRASQPSGVIPLVQAHMLRTPFCRRGPDNRNALKRIRHHLDVRGIGSVNRQPHGDAVGIGEQAPFDAFLATVGGIGAAFFPRPEAPWSSLRPWNARSSQCLSSHHTEGDLPPRDGERLPLPPMPGNGDEPWSRNRFPWHPGLSIDILYAGRRGCH